MKAPACSEIHVWLLKPGEGASSRVWNVLAQEEQRRVEGCRSTRTREAFVRSHGYLRCLLGRYLDKPPERLEFLANDHGKPRLKETAENQGLVFNLSHSGGFALLAFALDTPLGADIEVVKPRRNLAGLAEACLAPAELDRWRSLPPEQRLTEFIRLWVCKEAFAKATGRGIALGVSAISVGSHCNGFESVPNPYSPAAAWKLRDWAFESCRAAVVYRGAERRIKIFTIRDYLEEDALNGRASSRR
jgi:4'-phosphopantetheinyl transferase